MSSSEWAKQVEEFTVANGYPVPARPTAWLKPKVVALRLHLMIEELGDVSRALNERHLVKLADGLCDLLYTVVGTAVEAGLGPVLDQLFAEVHRSNMTKDLGPVHEGHRGAVKGARYEPPRIAELLDDYTDTLKKINEAQVGRMPCCPNMAEGKSTHSDDCHLFA